MSLPSDASANVIPLIKPDAPAGQAKIVSTSSMSPDTLPPRGFSTDALVAYLKRSLGEPQFDIELDNQQLIDCVYDAMNLYSIWRPRLMYHSLVMTFGVHTYLQGIDMGFGVVNIDFVEPNPVPTELFYGNLIDPAPLFRTGLDEYDTFLRWRKIWMRVTSVKPDWLYDDDRQCLYIHNPIQRYHAGITAYGYYRDPKYLPVFGAQWVKDYSLEKARFKYADVMNKFSGAIPGPIKDLQLDTVAKRDGAVAAMDKMLEALKGAQLSTPLMIDALIGVLVPWIVIMGSLGACTSLS